ncbi:TetR/AcrR family transcriptional regulator [Mycolicibacterium confluentis]|uniref:TetR family transcriptional regulator n=1 Tax=Mycolicibacterium confluentis TaxID=28047 RepID=A0A7I7XSI1_9MYCO|nr:TetR/AcrR family transcriptional regulator [Mycolicibacterium confluentis]BBZ32190.1 TetR family transcriptional regulator [Mycolicibacterium confluentis]
MQPFDGADGTPEERSLIIDAAYACLSGPRTGPVPVAAILERAGVSTRAFYRHFESKDALFIAMLERESDELVRRLEHIPETVPGGPVEELRAWVEQMFDLVNDPRRATKMDVIDSDEVRVAKGYCAVRDRIRAERERSLIAILDRGLCAGVFPDAEPSADAAAISGAVSRVLAGMADPAAPSSEEAIAGILSFAHRALGVHRTAGTA